MEIKQLADQIQETWESPTKCTSAELRYLVLEPTSKQEALSLVFKTAPETYGGLLFESVRYEDKDAAGNLTFVAVYDDYNKTGTGTGGISINSGNGEKTVNFDCSAETLHITHPIRQVCVLSNSDKYIKGEDYSDIAIGWNGKHASEAEYAGVDIHTGCSRETYTKTMSRSKVESTSWKRKVHGMVGTVNSNSFHGWKPGELVFLGCSYSTPESGASKVSVSFHFLVRLNEKDAMIAGYYCGEKYGHEYLWAIHETKVKGDNLVQDVLAVFKAQVMPYSSFSSLGL